jgi:hypothetical protein
MLLLRSFQVSANVIQEFWVAPRGGGRGDRFKCKATLQGPITGADTSPYAAETQDASGVPRYVCYESGRYLVYKGLFFWQALFKLRIQRFSDLERVSKTLKSGDKFGSGTGLEFRAYQA